MRPIDSELQTLLKQGEVVPFIGAGVTTATVGAPGWWTLLQQGFKYVEDHGLATAVKLDEARKLLAANELTAAADELREMLGAPAGEYPTWLNSNFHYKPKDLRNPEILERLHDLLCPSSPR